MVLSSFSNATITDGNILYYTLDNDDLFSNNIFDLTETPNNGTNDGMTTGSTGIINQSFASINANNRIITPDSSTTNVGGGLFSINMWANCTFSGADYSLFSRERAGSDYWAGRFLSDNKFYVWLSDAAASNYIHVKTTNAIAGTYCDGDWHMWTYMRNTSNGCVATDWLLYIDNTSIPLETHANSGSACVI
jgi:hypothetical protein